MRRVVGLVAVLAAMGALTTACKKEADQKFVLGKIITATEQKSRKFVYLDSARGTQTQVAGVIEDDFRYKTRLVVNGRPVADEVTNDDALAVRFLAPEQLPKFLSSPGLATSPGNGGAPVGSQSGTAGIPPVLALQTQRWVLDKTGAPNLLKAPTDRRKEGADPAFDSLTALDYVRKSVNAGLQVKKYKRDDIEPVYKEKEDPFPKPAPGAKTIRYDIRPPALPKADARGATGNQQTPGQSNFRKMVVYVRDGVIVEIREQIDVASKLNDVIRLFNLPANTTVDTAVFAINAVRGGQGDDLIRVRRLTVRFEEIGQPLKVVLPTDAVQGSLTVLKNRGHQVVTGAPAPTPSA